MFLKGQTTASASIPLTGSNCFCHQPTFYKMSTEYKPDRIEKLTTDLN